MKNLFKGYSKAAVTFILFISLISCKQEKHPPEDMVAQVNDSYLLKKQLDYSIPSGLDKDVALALRKEIISRWVSSDALYQAALNEGFKLSPRDAFFVDEYRKALLVQDYLDRKLIKEYKISARETEEYYRAHKDEFVRNEDEVHVIHLWMEQRDNAIFKEIGQSDDLMAIIKKYFFDQKSTKERPIGDLGYVPLSSFPQQFVRVLKRMKINAVSRPLKTDQGYHFFQLLDLQKKGSLREMELVKSNIMLRLKQKHLQKAREQLTRDVKEKAQIQTYLSKIQD